MSISQYVLISGASSGIGADFARLFAAQGHSLILVARRLNKLEELRDEILEKNKQPHIDIKLIKADLLARDGVRSFYELVVKSNLKVHTLVNNAGFGEMGYFHQVDIKRQLEMIDLNVKALTELTYLFIPMLIESRKGRILNVASTASFQPGPNMAVYCATKAYVLSFSEAIRVELKQYGIHVCTLCPGATQTEFAQVAHAEGSRLFGNRRSVATSSEVAEYGVWALDNRKSIAIHGTRNKTMAFMTKILPRSLVVGVAHYLMSRK